ncbi:MAG: glycogen debranching N-terminal domain-containing protein, partial [Chloroflexota bacterium]
MAIEDIRDALVIRENGVFLLMDKCGNVPRRNESGFGLYRNDTRFLSRYEFSFSQAAPIMLLSTAALGFAAEQVSTNPGMTSLDGTSLRRESIEVRRQRIIGDGVEEHLRVTSFDARPITLECRYSFAADFADIFDVRGLSPKQRGRLAPVKRSERSLAFGYEALDGRQLHTRIDFSAEPASLNDSDAVFHLKLRPRETATLSLSISMPAEAASPAPIASGNRLELLEQQYQ